MTKTLAFDTATRAGWACGDTTGPRLFGAFEVRGDRQILAPRILTFGRIVLDLIREHEPGLVAFETPVLNPRRDNALKCRWLYGVTLAVEIAAHKAKVPCVEASAGEVRTHFLGAGYPKASKKVNNLLRVKCWEMGWDVPHNESDEANALALLDYLLSLEDPRLALKSTSLLKDVA